MPEEINTNDINSNEINEQILLNQDEKITETNQLLGATMQQNEERKQLIEAGLMAQEAIKEKMNGKPSIYVSTIIDAFLESLGEKLKGKDGQKGEKGDMPKKGVDYFTPEEINDIQEYVQSQIRVPEDGYTPIKGIDYFTPDEINSIVSQVRNLIPTPKDGRDGREATIDYDIIVKRVLKEVKIPEVKNITASDILKKIKGKIDYNDIKNTPTIFKQGGFKGGMAGQGYFKDLADVNFSDAVNDQTYALKRVNNVWTVTKTDTETSWGEILGTLTDQTDLKNALNGKVGTTGNETIAGIKTFSSIPVLPATNPTTDNQATRKGYVDSLVSGAIVLQGDWDASTNTPDISGTTKTGSAWRVSVAGTTDIGGITDWQVGDLAVKTANGWIKIDNEDIKAVWGGITGTLSNQTDLQNALNLKAPLDSPLFTTLVSLANNIWLRFVDYSGTGFLNTLKGNQDDSVDVGVQLNVGSIEAEEDAGRITRFDMPVSSSSADGTIMSATDKIDGNNVLEVGAYSDGAGGIDGRFVKNYGANIQNVTSVTTATYSILASDNIIHSTYSATGAVTITLPTAQLVSGRIITIKDAGGLAGTNNITIATEGAEKIDGLDTLVINNNYNSVTLYSDGTNWFAI